MLPLGPDEGEGANLDPLRVQHAHLHHQQHSPGDNVIYKTFYCHNLLTFHINTIILGYKMILLW
jgi:hypothetical protein